MSYLFRGGAVYAGPDSTKYYALSGSEASQQVDVLWREKTYYYIHLNSGYNGYVSTSKISGSPNVSVFTPSISTSTKRYVGASENAYLGPAAHYSTTHAPNRAQMVDYLGKKGSGLAFIEYNLDGYTRKFRAWFPANSLNTNKSSELTADEYERRVTEVVKPTNYPNDYDSNGNLKMTYCNWYAYYAMEACGTPLFLRESDNMPASCEQLFNTLSGNTFKKWRVIDTDKPYEEAQARANNGYPTLALEPKHVAVVIPNGNTIPSSKLQVRISQAGASIFDDGTINEGWGQNNDGYPKIKFFSWYY